MVTLIRTLRPMATAAREQQWSAPFAMKELERRHGETKAAAIAKDAARVWEPLGADRALFEDDWIEDYPDAIERIAKFADKFFSSDAGLRLTLERSAAALAAKERGEAMEREKAKAEAVERDRQINEQFGR